MASAPILWNFGTSPFPHQVRLSFWVIQFPGGSTPASHIFQDLCHPTSATYSHGCSLELMINWTYSTVRMTGSGILCFPGDTGGKELIYLTQKTEKWKWKKVKVKPLSCVRLFATPWTAAYQAPPSMGFSRQAYWSRLPFPSPGDFPNPRIKPGSPALQADALPSKMPIRSLDQGRSPGGGHGSPVQYSCLENSLGQRSLLGYSS